MIYSKAHLVKVSINLEIDVTALELTDKYFRYIAAKLKLQIVTSVERNRYIDFEDGSRLGINKLGRMYTANVYRLKGQKVYDENLNFIGWE